MTISGTFLVKNFMKNLENWMVDLARQKGGFGQNVFDVITFLRVWDHPKNLYLACLVCFGLCLIS